MDRLIKNKWHWQTIKLIVKQSLKHNNESKIIHQEMIDCMKNYPLTIKQILEKGNRAEKKLKIAVNQFNYVVENNDVDDSIYQIIECEKELHNAVDFANKEINEIFCKEE